MTSGGCIGGVRGTLQGEQYYLDHDSMDDHELEERGKEDEHHIQERSDKESNNQNKGQGQDKGQGIDLVTVADKESLRDKEKGTDKAKDQGSGPDGSSLWSWLSASLSPSKSSAQTRHTLSNLGQVMDTSNGTAVDASSSSSTSTPDTSCLFVGKYAAQRAKMDYSYHSHYQFDRQLIHDILIDSFLDAPVIQDADDASLTCSKPADQSNWLVFTAGCMGAGKGHTLNWLNKEGLFPLNAFVRVDPDVLRELLPETQEYIKRDPPSAGYLTQKEVRYITSYDGV